MGQRLDALAWMSAETKAKAKAKLATYNPKIGYPKKWRDYSALEVKAGDPSATRRARPRSSTTAASPSSASRSTATSGA